MTVTVVGIWEQGWNVPLSESYLWTFPLREYQVIDWRMTPVTGIKHNEQHTNLALTEYNNVDEMVASLDESVVRVFVDETGDMMLHEFVHPENAAYIFGNAGTSALSHRRAQDVVLRVETAANGSVMWPHQCLVTVLHDRLVKSWQSS